MFIKPKEPTGTEEKVIREFRDALGHDSIVAFAVGCPGVKDEGKAVRYQVNKIFQQLNIEGDEPDEPEEEDDYE